MNELHIGLFGFGVVGEGIYKVLKQKSNFRSTIHKICIKHPEKERNAPKRLFTTRADDILEDPKINVVVELIDDAEAALHLVRKAMRKGKSVVSANKKMIAENLEELVELQKEYGVSFLYEAAVCGSIPIIRNLEEYFDNDLLTSVSGIVNGSTNFILSQMSKENVAYEDTLRIAQEKGFAESNPTLDVEGIDAVNKLSIIVLHSFGRIIHPDTVIRKGITALHPFDFQFAKEKGSTIKLVATTCGEESNALHTSVWPTFIHQGEKLSHVENEYNAVLIGSSLADEQFLFGKGAGRYPTSSAVLSDLSALGYRYKYEYKKTKRPQLQQAASDNRRGKFYLSFHTDTPIDLNLFEEISESFKGVERNYVIGTISYEKFRAYDFWKRKEVSLVSFG